MICRLLANGKFETLGEIPKDLPVDLQNLIKEDRKFGFLKPNVDGWYTWRVYDGDKEITREEVDYIVRIALTELQRKFMMKFRPAKPNEEPILKIRFSTPQTDSNMTGMTLAYHYYPMLTNAHRGECFINRDYFYTVHGLRLNLHFIDPEHYPDASKAKKAPTWDLDQILRHEFGHGILGLMHDGQSGNIMSSSYSHMAEYYTERDLIRGEAKVLRRPKKQQWKEDRLAKWYMAKAEELPIWVEQTH